MLNLILGDYSGGDYTRLVCLLHYLKSVDLSLTLFDASIWYILGAHRHYHGPQGGPHLPANNNTKHTDSRISDEEAKL